MRREARLRDSAQGACALATLLSALTLSAPSHAQEALTSNDFRVDAVFTPVLASGRIVGLGGAFSPLAEGIEGVPFNPAAYAARYPYELDRFEYDVTASLSFPGALTGNDLFLNGQDEGIGTDHGLFLDLGARLQIADLGFGALIQFQTYDLRGSGLLGTDESTTANIGLGHFGGGYSFLHGQLVAGVGVRLSQLTIDSGGDELVNFTGVGAEGGLLLRPARIPIRLGVAGRMPVDATVASTDGSGAPDQIGDFVLPSEIRLPWELQAGFAFQLGPRPFNRRYYRPKNVARSAKQRLRWRQCERMRAQVLREHEERGVSVPSEGMECPALRHRPRDPAFLAEEQQRREAEQETLRAEIERAEDELEQHAQDLYDSLPRRYILFSADVLIIGPTRNAVGIDAFLAQERRRRGDGVSFAYRVGLETEPWFDRMKVRMGSYYEPARYEGVSGRFHGTFNTEFRLFTVFDFDIKAGGTIDIARDYFNWGLSVGFWH